MNKTVRQKTLTFLKVSVILTLLMTISSCRALSEMLDPDKNTPNKNLQEVKRDKPNLSSETVEINVDPDSDGLLEEAETNLDAVVNNSNTALGNKAVNANSNTTLTNNNLSNENTSLVTNANPNTDNAVPNSKYVLTFNSFGSVKVGMTAAQASSALGIKLVKEKGDEEACYYVDAPDLKGVRFMVTNEKIARIEISTKDYATEKGAKIGDTEDRIKSLYKGINVSPQKYDETKHDLEIVSEDEKYMIIFETDGNRVTGFRVGNIEEVGWVEGCS